MFIFLFKHLSYLFNSIVFSKVYILYFKRKKKSDFTAVNDFYIYKNINSGYSALYGEFSLQNDKVLFNSFNDDVNNLTVQNQRELFSFNFLQDIKNIDTETSNKYIQTLINGYLENFNSFDQETVLDIRTLEKRIFNIITSLKKFTSNEELCEKLQKQLSFEVNYYIETFKVLKIKLTLKSIKTMLAISVSLNKKNNIIKIYKAAVKYLEENFLPDGANISRDPSETLDNLEDLLFIYKEIGRFNLEFSNNLRPFVDRISIFIKTIRYKNSGIGVFYKGHEEDKVKVDFVLALANINANTFKDLRYSGYYVLNTPSEDNVSLLIKTNNDNLKKKKEVELDDSILSQEICIGDKRFIVNNSSNNDFYKKQEGRENYSTTIFYDKDGIIKMPSKIINVNDFKLERRVDEKWATLNFHYNFLKNSHNLIWHKSLNLEKNKGICLLGEELISPFNISNKKIKITKSVFQLILHPSIRIREIADNKKSIFFHIGNTEWVFKISHEVSILPVVYKGVLGQLISTSKICVNFDLEDPKIEWSLMKIYSVMKNLSIETDNKLNIKY